MELQLEPLLAKHFCPHLLPLCLEQSSSILKRVIYNLYNHNILHSIPASSVGGTSLKTGSCMCSGTLVVKQVNVCPEGCRL